MAAVKTEAQYKQYFSGSFKGMDSIIDDVLTPIFGTFTPTTSPTSVDYADDAHFGNGGANIDHIYDYGTFYTDKVDISVFEVILADNCHISIARKNIQNTVRRITETYSGAFIVFHYSDGSRNAEAQTWRLSWLKRLDVHSEDSPAKRYTYLCGPSYSCRTIAQRFDELQKNSNKTLDSITKAFDVEALSKDFFYEYKVFYDDIIQWITGTRYVGEKKTERKEGLFKSDVDLYKLFEDKCNDINKKEWDAWSSKQKTDAIEKFVRDWVKKLMGRMVFLQFIQKKGWLGISDKVSDWKGGSQNFLLERFYKCSASNKNFLKDELYAILFDSLNKSTSKDAGGVEITKRDGLKYPFLNGGLFEEEPADTLHIELPNDFFHNEANKDNAHVIGRNGYRENNDDFFNTCGLLDFFSHYNFTIDENASEDDESEVGIDPEMLSKVFENLLEDNKEKGAFYTPKEIVQYMCKESLIAYLCAKVKGIDESVRCFVEKQETDNNVLENRKALLEAIYDVKICDPAVGSGAFPMGLLNLILKLRLVLNDDADCIDKGYDYAKLMSKIKKAESGNNEDDCKQEKEQLAQIKCAIKKHIIQNNIYGVDIEKGAVDLARLRFWLNIVVDEDKPTPLPNLDFKIMQGNSLLEQFEGVDLSIIYDKPKHEEQICIAFDDEANAKDELWRNMTKYFSVTGHEDKTKLRKDIADSVCKLISAKTTKDEIRDKISNLDITSNDQFFLWHTWFADVFENGGFDIVIGNPPYIKENKNRTAFDGFRETSPYYQGKMDIWYGFACHSIDYLKQDGVLCFIAHNNWTTSGGAKKMRNKVINDCQLLQILDFNTCMVFESADIQTMIMLFKKNQETDNYKFDYRLITQGNEKDDMYALLDKRDRNTQYTSPVLVRKLFIDKLLTFSGSENSWMFEKIAQDKVFLRDDETAQGIVPNPDVVNSKNKKNLSDSTIKIGEGVFVVESNKFSRCSETEKKYIKPLYEPYQMKRYFLSQKTDKCLLYITKSNWEDDAPTLLAHLNRYKEIMQERRENKKGRIDFMHLHWPRNEKFFKEGAKILSVRKCTDFPTFVYYEQQAYVMLNVNVIMTNRWNMKFLTGVLNSILVAFWLRFKDKKQGNNYQVDTTSLQGIPLPLVCIEIQNPIIKLVDQILAAKKANPQADTTTLERKIDVLVYLLYGLTWDEVQIVENSLL